MSVTLQTAIKHLKYGIDEAKDTNEDLASASWQYEEGVLLSGDEAIQILDFIKKCQNEKNKAK